MAKQDSVILPGLDVIKFSLLQRKPDPYWNVRFRSPDGRRVERSTKCYRKPDARDAAVVIITTVYCPQQPRLATVPWTTAIERMKRAMATEGLRAGTMSDYSACLGALRGSLPAGVLGPADVLSEHVMDYLTAKAKTVSAVTRRGYIVKMRALWQKWFIDNLKICETNPWHRIPLPKIDKKDPRVLTDAEEAMFLKWIERRYGGWRLPVLWFMVKGFVGSRSADISCLKTAQLRDGRILFPAEQAKGREDRPAILPPALFAELKQFAGPTYVFESFHNDLRTYYRTNGLRCGNYSCINFSPARLVRFLQNATAEFRKLHSEIPYFKPHNFRGTAITRALELTNGNIDAVAIAFDCNPDTIRKYYAGLNKQQVADNVLTKLQTRPNAKAHSELT